MFPELLLPELKKHPPNNINSKIIKYDELQFSNPDPHAINKNIIGATPHPPPKNPFPDPLLLFVQQGVQQGVQQQSFIFFSQQHLFFFLDIYISPS